MKHHHLIPALAMLLPIVAPACAQRRGVSPKELRARLDKVLDSDWIQNARWITDFAKAKAEANKTGKQIFAYFTRSYAP